MTTLLGLALRPTNTSLSSLSSSPMPKAPKNAPVTRPTTRRSSRLNKTKDLNTTATLGTGGTSKSRRLRKVIVDRTPASTSTSQPLASTSDLRRSLRISPAELIKRERALLINVQELKLREIGLEQRSLLLRKKENEVSLILSQMSEREAKASLAQLEEHFTCALCCETLAHPYTLNPGQCGHTFCALCILKWFFSRLHSHCGTWHESVDCPMCRSLLVLTPDHTPRPDTTFPFVPNRTAAAVCESLIEKLRTAPSGELVVKREDSEDAWGSAWGTGCGRKKDSSKLADEKLSEDADVAGWREGGFTRTEWLKKDREGKREMNRVLKDWMALTSHDFRVLKQKLGV